MGIVIVGLSLGGIGFGLVSLLLLYFFLLVVFWGVGGLGETPSPERRRELGDDEY